FLTAAECLDARKLPNGRHGRQLSLCLAPAADDPRRLSVPPGQIFRGHTRCGSSAKLPHIVRFDERYEGSRRHLIQRHQKPQLPANVGILLHRHEAFGIVSGRHVVEESTLRQFEPPPWMDDDFAARLLARDLLYSLDGSRHREYLANFGFADM